MSRILEYNDKLGQVVAVDTRNDNLVGALSVVQQSMIPGIAKNLDIGGPMENKRLIDALMKWHKSEHGKGVLGAGLNTSVKALQSALNRLSPVIKNTSIRVTEDGLMGPKTQAATNTAMKVIGAKVSLPMTQTAIKTQAATLVRLIDAYIFSKTKQVAPAATVPQSIAAPSPTPTPAKPAPFKPTKTAGSENLQRALIVLSTAVNDSALKIAVDGIAGPKTQTATNLAFSRYVPTPRGVTLPLSPPQIQSGAQVFANAIAAKATEIIDKSKNKAALVQQSVNAAKAATPAKAAEFQKASVIALQVSTIALGKVIKNTSLSSLKPDGIMGPKTAAAVNLALSRYVSGVTPKLKTGKLTQAQISTEAAAIAVLISNERDKRVTAKPAPTAAQTSAVSAANVQAKAEAVKAVVPPAQKAAVDKGLVLSLQRALFQLGNLVKDTTLKVKADGIVGPYTQTATNAALKKYVRTATAQMKAGLSVASIAGAAALLTKLVLDETELRKQEALQREADAKAAASRLGPEKTAAVEATAEKAMEGDPDAQKEMQNVANIAVNSPDPEAQTAARDAMDVAVDVGPAEILPEPDAPEREIWAYQDERTITMPLDMLNDDAELGAMLGMREHIGETGWGFKSAFRSVTRAAKKVGKKGLKIAKKGLRVVKDIALYPLKLQWKLLRRLALPLAKQYCRLPRVIQTKGVRLAGVDPRIMVAFCHAIKVRNMKDIQKLFPVALKVAVKLAIKGQFPAAVPIIRSIKLIPGISKLPGMSFLSGDLQAFDTYAGTLGAMGACLHTGCGDELLLSDPHAMYDELEGNELTTMDGDLSDPVGWEYLRDTTGCPGC